MQRTAPRLDFLELFLDQIGVQLQLSDTQVKEAESHYDAVSKWLGAPGSPLARLDPNIYAQGSLRLKTTVKPIGRDEYDLDLVFEVARWDTGGPEDLLKTVYNRIMASDTYKGIVESPLPRCVRLSYSKQFHLDIVPARKAPGNGDHIEIPDRLGSGSYRWKPSNPKGYSEWFEAAATMPVKLTELRASIEPMPEQESFAVKPPLRRLVQLLKRWRDCRLKGKDAEVSSIILTTLAGHTYQKETTVGDSLTAFLERTTATFRAATQPPIIMNPANEQEVISEKWSKEPGTFEAFRAQLDVFKQEWYVVRDGATDPVKRTKLLNSLFGDELTATSSKKATAAVESLRNSGRLGVIGSTGALSSGMRTVAVPRNTFYGDDPARKAD